MAHLAEYFTFDTLETSEGDRWLRPAKDAQGWWRFALQMVYEYRLVNSHIHGRVLYACVEKTISFVYQGFLHLSHPGRLELSANAQPSIFCAVLAEFLLIPPYDVLRRYREKQGMSRQ